MGTTSNWRQDGGLQDPRGQGLQGRGDAGRALQLAEHAFHVGAHRAGADIQRPGGLLVAGPQADLAQDFQLPLRQRAGRAPCRGGAAGCGGDGGSGHLCIEAARLGFLAQDAGGLLQGIGRPPGAVFQQRLQRDRRGQHALRGA
ncbi:hypothetical protein G6F68_018530 [Rhizopus microsporus]|nr:hypothetical protein G6F68_018530 [Rhizopus microsporus]